MTLFTASSKPPYPFALGPFIKTIIMTMKSSNRIDPSAISAVNDLGASMLGTTLNARAFLERVGQELLRIDTAQVTKLADLVHQRYLDSKFVFIIGNGGSGSNASHLCEDLGKCTLRREDFDND